MNNKKNLSYYANNIYFFFLIIWIIFFSNYLDIIYFSNKFRFLYYQMHFNIIFDTITAVMYVSLKLGDCSFSFTRSSKLRRMLRFFDIVLIASYLALKKFLDVQAARSSSIQFFYSGLVVLRITIYS